jgi:hypothetical protein
MGLGHRLDCWSYLLRQRLGGRYVFIHINKCGGTSVEAALGIPKMHDTALARRRKIGRRRWEQAFTFALVRHPYDKVASLYRYRVRTGQTGLGADPIELNEWVRRAFEAKDPAYYDRPLMFAPCFDWVSDSGGKVIVDYIARLETIADDWPVIQERTGERAALPMRNFSRGERTAGREALDASARRIVQGHFRRDFEAFGYDA